MKHDEPSRIETLWYHFFVAALSGASTVALMTVPSPADVARWAAEVADHALKEWATREPFKKGDRVVLSAEGLMSGIKRVKRKKTPYLEGRVTENQRPGHDIGVVWNGNVRTTIERYAPVFLTRATLPDASKVATGDDPNESDAKTSGPSRQTKE